MITLAVYFFSRLQGVLEPQSDLSSSRAAYRPGSPSTSTSGTTRIDRFWERMQPLGPYRCQVLSCTSSDNPRLPQSIDPPSDADLFASFDAHLVRLWEMWEPYPSMATFNAPATIAAGLLLGGRLEMVDYILDHLPDRMVRNGYGNLIARRTVVAVLPLPGDLREWTRWIEGTPEAEAVRSRVARHRASLRWDPSSDKFVLAHSADAES